MKTRIIATLARGACLILILIPAVCWAQKKSAAQENSNLGEKNAGTAQSTTSTTNSHTDSAIPLQKRLANLRRDFLGDQEQIWTSPAHLRLSDSEWMVPLGGITAGLIVTDRDSSKHLSQNPAVISRYKTYSDVGVGALVGVGGGLWLFGHVSHNERWIETGFLSGEAALNSLAVTEVAKYSFERQRPYQDSGSGRFFQPVGTSFPSEHAAAAWAIAGIFAHEYPGPMTDIAAYGLASFIDVSRVKARQHFPSDVLIGSVIGDLVARDIYTRHHNFELGGADWRSITETVRGDPLSPASQGSPYVPLDSWIYPVLDRLAAMGLIDTSFAGVRPWTREACAQMVSEADDHVEGASNAVIDLVSELEREFRPELDENATIGNTEFRLESVYSRTEYISGMPLTDGFDFAQTQFDDFGRPYGEGWSTVNGFSAYATSGRWVGYFRGEEQTAPSIPALPLSAREVIAGNDAMPVPPATPSGLVMRPVLLDTYVGLMLSNWEISFGRQSLWWGSGDDTSLELSDNAPPIDMIRINRTTPLQLPGILSFLGSLRTEFFLGRLTGFEFIDTPTGLAGQWGQTLPDQPFIHGQNISFKPTPNFEFGFYRTTIFAGEGHPFTTHSLIASLFDTGNSIPGASDKPGKRTSGLDLNYRLPFVRNWATVYADGFTYDEFSPIAYPTWSAWHAGLYVSHFPGLSKLDFKAAGVYTDIPKHGGANYPGTFYGNDTWRNGYTNERDILGSWIGRGGQGAQASTNYWFNARSRLQVNFRHEKVSHDFIPFGGTLTDFGIRSDYWFKHIVGISTSVQYERWLFPIIQPAAETDISAFIEIQLQPQRVFRLSPDKGTHVPASDPN